MVGIWTKMLGRLNIKKGIISKKKLSVCRIDGVKECKDGNRCFHLFKNKKV